MAPMPGSNGMVFMYTGIPEETRQNELYLQVKEMNATLIRDKVSSTYNHSRILELFLFCYYKALEKKVQSLFVLRM